MENLKRFAMNRAERRRKKHKPDAVYQFRYSDIENIKKKATSEAVASASVIMLAIPLKVARV